MFISRKLRGSSLLIFLSILSLIQGLIQSAQAKSSPKPNSAIFFHPDGMSAAHWGIVRLMSVGPDGLTAWDELPAMALYKSSLLDSVSASSNGGATIHAYGVKAQYDSFGMIEGKVIRARSGQEKSILEEARDAGKKTALINSGSIIEPGTAVFVAKVDSRENHDEIAKQVVQSGVDIILAGGEKYLLPRGVSGRFGRGSRADDLNLIEWAKAAGYEVVYTLDELAQLASSQNRERADKLKGLKVLGVFSWDHTFNDKSEEELRRKKLPYYKESAPTLKQMAEYALAILEKSSPKGFFMVIEEEGTDNFSNQHNASGLIEAGLRAEEALKFLSDYSKKQPNVLLLVASDSDASGIQAVGWGPRSNRKFSTKNGEMISPRRSRYGSPYDGVSGTATAVFRAKPDRKGQTLPFVIAWATEQDTYGGVVVKAQGSGSDRVQGTLDNTDIYRILYLSLFGKWLE